jgi:N,N'-diacetyllegionaminate synthase
LDFFARQFAFSENDPPVVIAEAGVNHNGDVNLAKRLIDVAADAGAPIVKFQAFKTEKEISRFAELAPYQKETSPDAQSQFDLCKALELGFGDFRALKQHADACGIGFLCSVFDFDSIDFIADDLKAKAVKVASGEVTNAPLLDYVARKKLAVILSTGASTLAEVAEAVATLKKSGCPEIVLLHCVSNYPAPANELNLSAMRTLKTELGLPVGFSDHSMGNTAAIAAAAMGAVAIEKHFTLDRAMTGPDHKASSEPSELKQLVDDLAQVHAARGDGVKQPMPSESENRPLIRRSLVAAGALAKGTVLTRAMIEIKRPADGIDPRRLQDAIGRKLIRDLRDDEPIRWSDLA